ncbi:hypothetical protein GQ44DRAFT_796994 [Phaeosphaeriaceae sp. PMI808]|nr:hypothetical protein GQ44DRAFT_796994 [Phaeosphaeriaceae sp. PMI808]
MRGLIGLIVDNCVHRSFSAELTIVGKASATSNDTCLEELAKILEAELGVEYPHKCRRTRCIGHIINLALQAFLLARSKEALRAALEATHNVEPKFLRRSAELALRALRLAQEFAAPLQ